jgi:hypothetical protein
VGRSKPYRARQKSVTPNQHEEPCDPNGFKVRSTFESLFGSFSSEKEQFYTVAKDRFHIIPK